MFAGSSQAREGHAEVVELLLEARADKDQAPVAREFLPNMGDKGENVS